MRYRISYSKYMRCHFCDQCKHGVDRYSFTFATTGYRSGPCPECGECKVRTVVGRWVHVIKCHWWLGDIATRRVMVPKGSELIVIADRFVEIAVDEKMYRSKDHPEFRVVTEAEALDRIEEREHGYGG